MNRSLFPALFAGAILLAPAWARAQSDDASAPPAAPAPAARPPLGDSLTGSAKTAYDLATRLLSEGNAAGALAQYDAAYQQSSDARLLFDMAICARDMHRYARMLALLERYEREAGAELSVSSRQEIDAAIEAIRPRVGALRIAVNEPGAAVSIDGEAFGATPLDAPAMLDAGKHVLSIKKEGFVELVPTIEVAGGGEVSMAFVLVRAVRPAHLDVVAETGALLLVDGRAVGSERFDASVPPGPHELRATAPGKKRYELRFDLADGEARTFRISLEPERRSAAPIWPWIVAGSAAVAAAAVGGYFALRPHSQGQPSLGTLDATP
jgi:hypothetical protein